ncbi:MAG: SiaB family protein kinase [Desulfohalobiaceae bacterium]|nr:SiaB family protein kinase [Desulfohalobiaceae bacterium]
MMAEIQKFYDQLKTKGIIFSFSGPVSQNLLESIGETLKQKMNLEETSTIITRNVFAIFVELVQNVINYSAERVTTAADEPEISSGMLIIGREDERFYILSGNYIMKEQEASLTEKLTRIQAMDKEELKIYYKDQRRRDRADGSKGAGLGFIEMARKASQPIEFEIAMVNEKMAFFVVKAVI